MLRVALIQMLALTIAAGAHAQTSRPSGGPQEGITVHGHWAIDVRNPDGSLAAHHEFENSRSVATGVVLAGLLTRSLSGGYWKIALTGVQPICPGGPLSDGTCLIQQSRPAGQPGEFPPGPGVFDSLTSAMAADSGGRVVLTGTATALADGLIHLVTTTFGSCVGATSPGSCGSFGFPNVAPFNTIGSTEFSRKFLGDPGGPPNVQVVQGQIIQVTVTFTFS